jgi:DNA polymerase III subunit epsilon
VISEFNLCPKYCGIHTGAGPCIDHLSGKCKGICNGLEEPDVYNQRVQLALKNIRERLSTRLIIDEGREYNERSVILIDNGVYKGFGYYPADTNVQSADDAYRVIQPYKHNPDVQRILDGWQ